MHVIIVRDIRKKAYLFVAVVGLWCLMLFISVHWVNKDLLHRFSLEGELDFSYPTQLRPVHVYYDDKLPVEALQVSATSAMPIPCKLSALLYDAGTFSFQYPPGLALMPEKLPGSEIQYHITLQNSLKKSQGFIQVWKMPGSLKDFLDQSKATSTMSFKSFSTKTVPVNHTNGILWDYTFIGNDLKPYKGMEVFFKKGDRMYRISYFGPEAGWDQGQSALFWGLVNSFTVK